VDDELPRSGPCRLEVTLSGPVAASVLGLLDDRYDHVTSTRGTGAGDVVPIDHIDQAGE
jgi:hypothetical protein